MLRQKTCLSRTSRSVSVHEDEYQGTRVVLEQACRLGVGQFIHVSTDVGAARSNEASDDSPFRPGNAYAASKVV